MNGGTLLWWWIIVLCLYQLPASILDPNCTGTLQILGVLLVASYFALKWLYQKWM